MSKKVLLNLDDFGGKEPSYFTYKGKEYRIRTIDEIPTKDLGAFRRDNVEFSVLMEQFEDSKAFTLMFKYYFPELTQGDIENMSSGDIKKLSELMGKLNEEATKEANEDNGIKNLDPK